MGENEILGELKKAILNYDSDAAVEATKNAIEVKMDPMVIIEKAVIPAIENVGDKFEKMEIFLPDLMLAADATKAALSLVLPLLPEGGKGAKPAITIATVQGDVHEIGKNIVASMLMSRGFNVIDLGVDVKTGQLIEKTKKSGARIICASALMSSTMGSQKDIIDYLAALGERKKFTVLIGGGPTSQEWADEIRADGWGADAADAVRLVEKFAG